MNVNLIFSGVINEPRYNFGSARIVIPLDKLSASNLIPYGPSYYRAIICGADTEPGILIEYY